MSPATTATVPMGKAASKSQPAPSAEPAGIKSMKDSITVLKEQPKTTSDADDAQCASPNQKATTTRPKRAHAPEPSTAKSTKDCNEGEDSNTVFAKSSIIVRTPPQTCCTPPDVAMAPKKKETTRKLRGSSATTTTAAQPSKQSDEARSTVSTPENLIEALKIVQEILSQKEIEKEEKLDAQQTIGLAIGHIMAMNEKLKECHEQHGKQTLTEDASRLVNIENELAKLRKAITEPPQTYAQAVQRNKVTNSTGNPPTDPEYGIKGRMEKLRQERAKTDVVLTTRNASDNTKDQFVNTSEEALTNSLQQAIASAGKENVKIRRIQKTLDHGLKIRCATHKDAEELRSIDWRKVFEGVSVVEKLHRVVFHGVSKYDIDFARDKPEEIIAQIRGANSEDISVERVEPLMKRPRNPAAPTQSIVISFKCPKEADNCIEMGIHMGHRHYAIAERYFPQCRIKQCFKCQAYGHKANVCTRKAKCGKCAQEHETRECQTETIQCANCKGAHCAWVRECPVRQQKREQGEALRNELSDFYTS
jgi:hypothetical protein